ncbi:MAG: TrmH family RNA methyltransferase [Tepidisphaeraceae bacterium]
MLIESIEDPRLNPYRHFTSSVKYESPEQFVAEGQNVVLRLLASSYACESVLCAERKVEVIRPHLQAGTELFIASDAMMKDILGFKFHSGVIAVGRRRPWPTIRSLVPPAPEPATVLVLPDITDPTNLGAILRNAAAFGVTAVLLGESCRDPFARQSVRTSMGTLFSLPVARAEDLRSDLRQLQQDHAFECWATVLAPDAIALPRVKRPPRVAVLLGNEGPGLEADLIGLCDRRVTLPMQRGTDSLNVAAASAVFLYQLTIDTLH